MTKTLKAPFPFFGGKSSIAHVVWNRFGDVTNYVEPFFGSGAVLLARPTAPRTETVNDANAFLANFWRALQADPDAVALHADWPVNECDLQSRHLWLVTEGAAHAERCKTEPDYYDAKIAGWWVWGACQWIGSGWCDAPNCRGAVVSQLPHLGDAGLGLHRPSQQMPDLMTDGKGLHRLSLQMPDLRGDSGATGAGIHASAFEEKTGGIQAYLQRLSERLRRVRVCCGDWARVTGPSVTWRHGLTGVFLDPPYSLDGRAKVYAVETDAAAAARAWRLENGDNPLLRIALCGYAGEGHEPLEAAGWRAVRWKARGGYGSQGEGRGRENARRETIWFSPHCLSEGLFEEAL